MKRVALTLEYPFVSYNGEVFTEDMLMSFWTVFQEQYSDWQIWTDKAQEHIVGVRRFAHDCEELITTNSRSGILSIKFCALETLRASQQHLEELMGMLATVCRKHDLLLLTMGCHPLIDYKKAISLTMEEVSSRRLLLEQQRIIPMATQQVSIDMDVDEWTQALNTISGLSGLAIALMASSPLMEGKEHEWKEARKWMWQEWHTVVPSEIGAYMTNDMPQRPYQSIGDYVRFFWNSTLFFVTNQKGDEFELVEKLSFIDFLSATEGVKVRNLAGEEMIVKPTVEFLNTIHQYGWPGERVRYTFDEETTVAGVLEAYNDARLDEYFHSHIAACALEFRPCGVAAKGEEMALPALILGLLENIGQSHTLFGELSWEEWIAVKEDAQRNGLSFAEHRERNKVLLRSMLDVARSGLLYRGKGEELYLDPLYRRLAEGRTLADDILSVFRNEGMDGVVRKFSV